VCVCHCRWSAKCKSRQLRASCGGSDKGLTAQIPIGLIMTGPRLCYCSIENTEWLPKGRGQAIQHKSWQLRRKGDQQERLRDLERMQLIDHLT
jgi:hypothetical protein